MFVKPSREARCPYCRGWPRDDAGDVVTVFGEHGFESGGVVVVDDDRVLGLGSGDSGVSGREKVANPEPA